MFVEKVIDGFHFFKLNIMKKNISLSIIFILTIIVCVLIITIVDLKKYYNAINLEYSEKLHEKQIESSIRMKRDSNELFTENSQLNDILLVSINNAYKNLNSVISKPKLVYRFSEYSCRTCVENDLKIIKMLANVIGVNNIIIIAKFNNIKNLKIYIENDEIPFECYNYRNILNIPIEQNSINDSPCFFLLDSNLKIDFAYTSNPAHTINSQYFTRIKVYFTNLGVYK